MRRTALAATGTMECTKQRTSSRRAVQLNFPTIPCQQVFPISPAARTCSIILMPMLSTFDCSTVYNCAGLSQTLPRCQTEHGGFDLEKRRRGIIEGSLFVMDTIGTVVGQITREKKPRNTFIQRITSPLINYAVSAFWLSAEAIQHATSCLRRPG